MKASFDPVSGKKAPPLRSGHLLCAALVCGALGCNGVIGQPGPSDPPDKPGPVGPGGNTGPGAVDPGSKGIHRLNSEEYNNTVADLLGTKLQPANSSWQGGEIGGFDNVASVLNVDEAQFQRYFDSATAIADDVFAAADLKARVLTCVTEDAACVQGIIGTTGRRLFRRPLSSDEIGTYNKVYTAARGQGESHELSIKQVLRALLSSAEFIYRIETDATPNTLQKHPLNPFELASRLSYFLWSSAPDDTLLAAAADNSLNSDDKLRAMVDRMLGDPAKSVRFVENFAGQWLGARKLPEHAASKTTFPDWTPELANALTQEMYLFFAEFLKADRPWAEFMKADMNFVDASSARLYGMPAGGATIQRVENTTDKRFGFAGLGGFLAMSSLPERTSPTLRGRWILSNLLCIEPPPPPKDVPDLAVGGLDPTKNVRIALEEHRKNPSCAACHASFDPYGLSLEQFDGIGKFRTTYTDGTTIDPTAELGGDKFTGLQGLVDTVTKDPGYSDCISHFMFKYSLGRLLTDADKPYLKVIKEEWMKGTPSIRRLVQSLVLAETFRSRHGAAAN